MLGEFCQRYPGVDLSLKASNRERFLQHMSENEDDLYIFGQPPDAVPTIAKLFLEDPLVVVAPIDHPLAGQKAIPLERLVEQPMLASGPGASTRMAAERLLAKHGLKMQVRMELGSNGALKHAVIGGSGIAVLSRHTLPFESPGGRLTLSGSRKSNRTRCGLGETLPPNRCLEREAAVVPREPGVGLLGSESAAAGEPAHHPTAHRLADAGDFLSPQG